MYEKKRPPPDEMLPTWPVVKVRGGSAPLLCPQTPVIGSCSALAMVPPNQ